LVEVNVDVIVIDRVDGHSQGVVKSVWKMRERYRCVKMIGGNVGRGEGRKGLFEGGGDIVKVGMGGGCICRRGVVGGVGVAQMRGMYECGREARKDGKGIIGDGGIKY
ncbi:IMP dehydrogenase, partial [Bacillus sp. WP8]|uniref:IMP dehydrogenase n=1 Tax=Bacillus sp. WP8 TaxID=756828 RepID=UPI00119DFA70